MQYFNIFAPSDSIWRRILSGAEGITNWLLTWAYRLEKTESIFFSRHRIMQFTRRY